MDIEVSDAEITALEAGRIKFKQGKEEMKTKLPIDMMSATALCNHVTANMGLDVKPQMGLDGIKAKMAQAGFPIDFIEIDDGEEEGPISPHRAATAAPYRGQARWSRSGSSRRKSRVATSPVFMSRSTAPTS